TPLPPAVDCSGASRSNPHSNRQPGAALAAARAKDLAPAHGAHPGAETVGALATDDRGLVGTFHDCALREKSLVLERFARSPVKVNRSATAVDNSPAMRVQ